VKQLGESRTQANIFAAGHPIIARRGPRPWVPEGLPHVQADQWPPPGIGAELVRRASRLPNVHVRQSRMASAATNALSLAGARVCGPAEAFIDGVEFCHLLPPPEGTIHLMLPPAERAFAIEFGWGEQHPIAQAGSIWRCLVTLYAPRDEEELAMAMRLIKVSLRFARGLGDAEAVDD
jgi:hypothetical protein